ncbi:MAG TPA: CBS domain-containing protein [Ignavibacteriaceae bacterium]
MENIKEILADREVYTVPKGTTIKDTVFYMAEKGVGLVPILDEGKLVGVFSERDLVKRVIAKSRSLTDTKVEDVMSTKLLIAETQEPNESIFAKMKEANTRHILIIESEKLIGVLSMRDLLELDLSACKMTVEVLNNYIYSK